MIKHSGSWCSLKMEDCGLQVNVTVIGEFVTEQGVYTLFVLTPEGEVWYAFGDNVKSVHDVQ
jgi:hypothetical protein